MSVWPAIPALSGPTIEIIPTPSCPITPSLPIADTPVSIPSINQLLFSPIVTTDPESPFSPFGPRISPTFTQYISLTGSK